MLNKDLLRYKLADGAIIPTLARSTPGTVQLVESIIAHWQQGVGKRRGDLEDAALPIMHQSRALLVARGLQKLLLEVCRFSDPASSEALRTAALAASAELLRSPARTGDEHRAAVAERLGLQPDEMAARLYGDLPDAAILEAVPAISAATLIARYNLALCQGLLLHARELRVMVRDADTGLRRRLLKALRFRRLLAEVQRAPGDGAGDLRLVISGPGSLLDQANRYGLQLALFLPALACAKAWTAEADIAAPRRLDNLGGTARLALSAATGLVGDTHFLGMVPEGLRELPAALADKCPGWRFVEAELVPLPSGELVVPDLQMVTDRGTVAVELFHRWHVHALARRLDQLAAGQAPRLLIGVDRALAKTNAAAPLLVHPAFARHGFLFSDLPVPRALQEAVGRLLGAAPVGT